MIKFILWIIGLFTYSFSFSQNIKFSAFLNNTPLIFNKDIPFEGSFIRIEVFKIYISNIEFTYQDGSIFNENDSYHLIDLVNSKNDKLFITYSKEGIKQLSFDIGIDSTTNQIGAQSGDLDPLEGMYWTWQSGYIHLGANLRRYIALWPGRGLLVVDLWQGRTDDAATRFLIPGVWDVNDTGDFVSAGTKLIVRPLVGSMDGPAVSSHWYRFGVEEAAYRIDIRPETIDLGARCATLFVWDASFEFPNGKALQSLFDQLNTATPAVANID